MLITLISIVYSQINVSADAFKKAFFNFQVPKETLLFGVGPYDSENPRNNQQTSFSLKYLGENDKVNTPRATRWTKMDPKKLKKILTKEENIFVGKDFVLPMAKYFVSGLLSNDKRIISNEVSEEFLTIFYRLFLQPNLQTNKKNKIFYTLSLPSVKESKKILKKLEKKCIEHKLEFPEVFDALLASVLGFVSVSFEAHESIGFEENLREYIVEVGKFSPAENAINSCTTTSGNKLYSVQFTKLVDGITEYNVTNKGLVRVEKKYLDLKIFDTMLKKSIKKKPETESSKTLTELSYKIIKKRVNSLNSKVLYEILINKEERDKVLKIICSLLGLKSLTDEFVIRPGSETIESDENIYIVDVRQEYHFKQLFSLLDKLIVPAIIRSVTTVNNDRTEESNEK